MNASTSLPTTAPSTEAGPNYYELLSIPIHASAAEIQAAYERALKLYDPTYGAAMGDDFAEQAGAQRATLQTAYATLSDPKARFAYDQAVGIVGNEALDRRGVSNREVLWTIGGVLIGLLLLSLIYNLTAGRSSQRGILERFTAVNFPAKPIKLRTIDGHNVDLSQYRGKVVVVNFWGTWCEPCQQETPALAAAYHELRDQGLAIVGVDMFMDERSQYNRSEKEVQAFTQRYGVDYPIALDDDGNVTRDYQLYNIPVSFIVDPSGNVRYIRTGPLAVDDVKQVFQLLKHS